MLGRVLKGQYRIDGLLGRGAMGQVYRGVHLALGRQVAIKVLPPERESDSESLRRFTREARAASRLNHPHIAQVFDFGVDEGRPFLVMELCGGQPLSGLLHREAPFSIDRAMCRQRAGAARVPPRVWRWRHASADARLFAAQHHLEVAATCPDGSSPAGDRGHRDVAAQP